MFDKSIEYNFFFYKHQKIKLKFLKKNRDNANLIIKVGERKTTFSSIIISPECKYKRPLDKQNKDKDIFCIKVNKISVKDIINYTILDYLKSGVKISGYIAIDFSNGNNKEPSNLSIDKYKKIILKMFDKISIFTKNFSFYVCSYGGKIKNLSNDNPLDQSIFNINMTNDNILIEGEKFIRIFSECINNIIPDKKVNFSSIIRKLSKEVLKLYNI